MRIKHFLIGAVSSCLLALATQPTLGQLLYSEDFQTDVSSSWVLNDGPTDEFADFFFDYTAATSASAGHVGLPLAPNSDPGETTGRGMFLQANLFDAIFGGASVSPTEGNGAGQIPVGGFTGDYALTFDMWSNYPGDLLPGGVGTTNLSYGGILTSGTSANYAGTSDGVFFAYTGDGDSGADYRVYSSDRPVSYQHPADPDVPADLDATYHAGTRDHNNALYFQLNPEFDPVGSPGVGTVEAPAAQLALYSQQTGRVRAGAPGMTWRENEIKKIGDTVTWEVDGVLLITLDISDFETPTGGTNILFGHADIGSGVSTDPDAISILFTLVDNIEVNAVTASTENADFDGDNDVDGTDFLAWQQGFGINDGTAQPSDGDATGEGNVDALDFVTWKSQYGGPPPASAVTTVPEPGTWLLTLLAALAHLVGIRPSRAIVVRVES